MSRIALDFGFIQIYWYSICIIIGMAFGMYLVFREAKRKKINEDLLTNLVFNTIICAVIGARLYYVVFNWGYYSRHVLEIFEIWNGGLAIHGGILFGTLYLLYYTKKHKMNTLRIMDICCVGLIIGQICGRWGNFFNGEAYGPATTRAVLESMYIPKFVIDGMNIDGVYYHPTFLYESLWNFVGFVVLLIFRRFKYVKEGQLAGFYLMWYSLGRFFIEGLRMDSLMIGNFKVAQIISVLLFLIGFFLLVFRIKSSRFEYLYNSEATNEN